MIVRKYETKDEANFKTFIKSTYVTPVSFDKDQAAQVIVNAPEFRNYIVEDDSGNIIGGGTWSIYGQTMHWAVIKDQIFSLDTYMGLIHKMVTDCLAEGFTTGLIPVKQQWLVSLLK